MTTPDDQNRYSHNRHILSVMRAAKCAGISGRTFDVLFYMCSVADHGKPVVRVSQEKIWERTGCAYNTIRKALKTLVDAGFLEPVAYKKGGRGMATVHVIRTGKPLNDGGGNNAAETEKPPQSKARNPLKRWAETPSKYRAPSKDIPIDLPKSERSAVGAGSERTPLAEHDKQELALFSRECSAHGYTAARERAELRKSALAERLQGL